MITTARLPVQANTMNSNRANKQLAKNTLLKVVLLGDGGVGKSCIMNRYVSDKFDNYSYHTIGVEFLNKDIIVGEQTYTLQIWDTAGQERFRSLRTPFYRGSDICLLTFSFDDKESFDHLTTWIKEFLYYADVGDQKNFPFVIVGNKVDLEHERRQVTTERAAAWCNENNLQYVETSAKEATNIGLAFEKAVSLWVEMDKKAEKRFKGETVSLKTEEREVHSMQCC